MTTANSADATISTSATLHPRESLREHSMSATRPRKAGRARPGARGQAHEAGRGGTLSRVACAPGPRALGRHRLVGPQGVWLHHGCGLLCSPLAGLGIPLVGLGRLDVRL